MVFNMLSNRHFRVEDKSDGGNRSGTRPTGRIAESQQTDCLYRPGRTREKLLDMLDDIQLAQIVKEREGEPRVKVDINAV
jgi:hypothetical protein